MKSKDKRLSAKSANTTLAGLGMRKSRSTTYSKKKSRKFEDNENQKSK